ncbi:hypothetical protein AB0305_09455 [Arthrobacter sp. NPDC080086]
MHDAHHAVMLRKKRNPMLLACQLPLSSLQVRAAPAADAQAPARI